jgi:FkbM family methyltransferase
MELVKFKNFEVLISETEKFFLDGEHSAIRGLERFGGKPEVVVDIGAHIGVSALGAVGLGASTVYAFEAMASNFEVLWTNIRHNSVYGRVLPLNLAAWSESGAVVPLRIAGTNSGQLSATFSEFFTVVGMARTISLPDIIRMVGKDVDYLKVDIEGSEFWLFSATEENRDILRRKVKFLDLEIHDPINAEYFTSSWFDAHNPSYKNTSTARQELLAFLASAGFDDLLDEGKYLSGYNKWLKG